MALTLHEALGQAIFDERDRQAVTQQDLGYRVGMHRNYVGAIERGQVNPTLRTLQTVSGALGIRVSELLARAEALRA